MSLALSASEFSALWLSLSVASTAVVLALVPAIIAGWILSKDFAGKSLLDAIVHLPLILPPVVLGYLLLVSFGTRAPIGAWLLEMFGIRLAFSWNGAVLASALVAFPFQVRAIRSAIEAIDPGLGQAASTLGAGPVDRFFSLMLPLALPGILAGTVTAFVASLGQFGAIITFVSNIPGETQTLPLAIYSAIQSPGGEAIAARLVVLSIGLALAGLLIAQWLTHRLAGYYGR